MSAGGASGDLDARALEWGDFTWVDVQPQPRPLLPRVSAALPLGLPVVFTAGNPPNADESAR